MKKTFRLILLFILSILPIFFLMGSVHADTGPKPSLTVTVKNMKENGYSELYITYLSKKSSHGPWQSDEVYSKVDEDIDAVFSSYKDPDGYYYLHYYSKITEENNSFAWIYYPPEDFKILLLDKSKEEFIVIPNLLSCEHFESEFELDLNKTDSQEYSVKSVTNYRKHLVNFVIRLFLCLAVEIGLAFAFHFKRVELIYIGVINIVTQLIFNIILYFTVLNNGMLSAYILFFVCEFFIFIFESIAYTVGIPILNKKMFEKNGNEEYITGIKKWYILVIYSLCANVASLVAGIIILSDM